MAHPNENFINLSSDHVRVSDSDRQPAGTYLFSNWFANRPENLGNVPHLRVSNPFNSNLPIGLGLSLSTDQEVPPQQFFTLQEQVKLMKEQMVTQNARME